jgi:hypothetical protein
MRKIAVATGIVFSMFFGASHSQATSFVAIDGWQVGDALLTRDTSTGLDWLDLTVTHDKSVNNILTDGFGGLVNLGFRVATVGEVGSLLTNAGATIGTDGIRSTENYSPAVELITFIGCVLCQATGNPFPGNAAFQGATISSTGGLRWGFAAAYPDGTGFVGISGVDQFSFAHHQLGSGVFLVRNTPALDTFFPGGGPPHTLPLPSSLSLLGISLIGLMLAWRLSSKYTSL